VWWFAREWVLTTNRLMRNAQKGSPVPEARK
jgi:hypothetical protein